jgi:phenylacetate-coenzyme A ligase PaaK-like adenylate-forming protein
MPNIELLKKKVFTLSGEEEFNKLALDVFRFQFENNQIYRQYVQCLNRKEDSVKHYSEIPFLPIEFFKSFKVVSGAVDEAWVFSSSGTTGIATSKHYVKELALYEKSFLTSFVQFFGRPEKYVILGLLPSYLERKGSSLVYMVQKLIDLSAYSESGFYLDEYKKLQTLLKRLKEQNIPVILFGVSFALMEMAEQFPMDFPELIIMETGGMKGRRKELVREELHSLLKKAFGVEKIYSEYGMTELLSQAYSKGDGIYQAPPWMKILIRDVNDPFCFLNENKTGGVNVIDLANLYSCSFIETQDLGKKRSNGFFEILGRFDHSDVRGCNLLVV